MPLSQYSHTFHSLLKTGHLRAANKGELVTTTENLEGIHCLKEGFVKRYLIKNDGSISVQGIYGPGDCFGITVLSRRFMGTNVCEGKEIYYYEAINKVIAYKIDNQKILTALQTNQELYKDLFTIQSWHSLSDVWHLENLGLENALKRVAHIVCFYMERYGRQTSSGWKFKVPFIQQDLADILNLSRETVSLAVSELKRLKLIKGRRKIIVPDIDALKDYAYS